MKEADLGANPSTKRTLKRVSRRDAARRSMGGAHRADGTALPEGKDGSTADVVVTMLRAHFLQQLFGLSDPAMEEVLHDVPLYREFADLEGQCVPLSDESTILRFRHRSKSTTWPPRAVPPSGAYCRSAD